MLYARAFYGSMRAFHQGMISKGLLGDRQSDQFDEKAEVGLGQLLMIRLAQKVGKPPEKLRGRDPRISNQQPIAEQAARHFSEDEELWGLAGLLHDLDAEATADDMTQHTHQTVAVLREEGVNEEIIDAIRMHNEEAHAEKRSKRIHHALAAGETITGLIIATALVYPDKKLASVKPRSVVKRMKEKKFAASVSRENIMECEKTGIPLSEFVELSLKAMTEISDQIGL
jgi:putative nucleotidyltransferase with HDIG domain